MIQQRLKDVEVSSDRLEDHVAEQIRQVAREMLRAGRFDANVRLNVGGAHVGSANIWFKRNAEHLTKEALNADHD